MTLRCPSAIAAGLLALVATHCSRAIRPDDAGPPDASSDIVRSDADDAPTIDAWALSCDPMRLPCNLVVNICAPDLSTCQQTAQCAAGVDGPNVAHAICTAGTTICAQADRCTDDASLPSAASCRCGAGPACPSGAICVSAPGVDAHCECLPAYLGPCQSCRAGVDVCGMTSENPRSHVCPASGRCPAADGSTNCPVSDGG